jgi:hypothetical protein
MELAFLNGLWLTKYTADRMWEDTETDGVSYKWGRKKLMPNPWSERIAGEEEEEEEFLQTLSVRPF